MRPRLVRSVSFSVMVFVLRRGLGSFVRLEQRQSELVVRFGEFGTESDRLLQFGDGG